MSLSDFNPLTVRYFKWGYTWDEIKKFYVQKTKEYAERTNAFCTFLVELTSAALGGGKKDDEEIALDSGEGMDELSDEQIEKIKATLGEADFAKMYPDYA